MVLTGIPVSRGIVVGTVFNYQPQHYEVSESYFEAGEEEKQIQIFETARKTAQEELRNLGNQLQKKESEQAKIFFAHKQILDDEELLNSIDQAIKIERKCVDYAISTVFQTYISILKGVNDPLIAARCADLYDVRNRLLRVLYGHKEKTLSKLPVDTIVVAHELLPSDTIIMDHNHCIGIVNEMGSDTSHSAIIARSYGIPAIVGVVGAVELLQDGDYVIVDAISGRIEVNPKKELIRESLIKVKQFQQQQEVQKMYQNLPGMTADGQQIELGINIGANQIVPPSSYYDFVGLLRTEFLYMEADHLPTEEEQFQMYKRIVEIHKGKVVTLRTMDLGADKTLSYRKLPKEENPALGKRALRLCLEEKELFISQLKAALRASAFGPLQIMFPMVGSMEDIYHAKAMLELAKEQLRSENIAFNEKIKVGIMIEVPSVALIADIVAEEVDFASIGTNDLTQYVCAVDRMNTDLISYYQSLSPAMIRILSFIFEQFEQLKKPISVCGELAGNPQAAILLIGLGARKLSMSEANLFGVKAYLSKFTMEEAYKIAECCKKYYTEEEVKKYLKENIK